MEYTKEKTGDRFSIKQSLLCGCEIRHYTNLYSFDESFRIAYCSKHAVAPAMYEALKLCHEWLTDQGIMPNLGGLAREKAFEALAKAEGMIKCR